MDLKDALINKYELVEKYKIFLDENSLSKINNSESNNINEFSEIPKECKTNGNDQEESICSSAAKNNRRTNLTIRLKSKFHNDNNFFFSILKANGETISNKDFTQNFTKSDLNSTVSDKKYEIASKISI